MTDSELRDLMLERAYPQYNRNEQRDERGVSRLTYIATQLFGALLVGTISDPSDEQLEQCAERAVQASLILIKAMQKKADALIPKVNEASEESDV